MVGNHFPRDCHERKQSVHGALRSTHQRSTLSGSARQCPVFPRTLKGTEPSPTTWDLDVHLAQLPSQRDLGAGQRERLSFPNESALAFHRFLPAIRGQYRAAAPQQVPRVQMRVFGARWRASGMRTKNRDRRKDRHLEGSPRHSVHLQCLPPR